MSARKPAPAQRKLEHYLMTIVIAADAHMHAYLMTDDERYIHATADRMLTEAEKLGCSHPLMGLILTTTLSDDVEAVREIIIRREPQKAKRMFRTATDFHWTIFVTCADDPADAQLLAMH